MGDAIIIHGRKIVLIPLVFLLFLGALPLASCDVNYYVARGQVFTFPLYGTCMGFDEDHTFGTVYRESSVWYFGNYQFKVQDANLTVTTFFESGVLEFYLNGSAFQSTTTIRTYNMGEPSLVEGAEAYEYDSGAEILTIYAVNSPTILVEWMGTPPGQDSSQFKGKIPPLLTKMYPAFGLIIVLGGVGTIFVSAIHRKLTRKRSSPSPKGVKPKPKNSRLRKRRKDGRLK